MGTRAVHLAKRRRSRRMVLEVGELGLPVVAELGAHAAFDEGPAHWRRLALQLGKLGGVFGRQRIRDGGEELRDLHDRPFEAAERYSQFRGVAVTVEVEPEQACARKARRYAADIGADAGIAGGAGGEAVLFLISHIPINHIPTRRESNKPLGPTKPWVQQSPGSNKALGPTKPWVQQRLLAAL